MTVLAGTGQQWLRNGPALTCALDRPSGLVVDESTNSCYVAEWGNNVIRKIPLAD